MAVFGTGEDRRIELQGAFPRGFSGAPVIACSDGALLGVLDQVGFVALDAAAGVGFHLGLAIPAASLRA